MDPGCLIDNNVVAVLPDVVEILETKYHGESSWAKATRVSVLHNDGRKEDYFMKVSIGHHGREALKGEFESTLAIYNIIPDFCPKPIAWGTYASDPASHFYICKFYGFAEGVPEPKGFAEKLSRLHSSHTSPNGKFGFHCVTYNGNLPQNNSWFDSWEAFFANSLRHLLEIREERAGPNVELDGLLSTLFSRVIPRLLRPLESDGRKILPSLVHGDLWYGNAGIVDEGTEEGIVYDPASFWAHNECMLSPLTRYQTGSLLSSQTSLATGAPSETNSLVDTLRRITLISPSPSLRKTTTIGMHFTPCFRHVSASGNVSANGDR
ncbi:Fructosamine kinase-domain-containing protein [Daldinia grandis]|nr:Fructosamine kinase-domain-containing protein [Daldinia grandis]